MNLAQVEYLKKSYCFMHNMKPEDIEIFVEKRESVLKDFDQYIQMIRSVEVQIKSPITMDDVSLSITKTLAYMANLSKSATKDWFFMFLENETFPDEKRTLLLDVIKHAVDLKDRCFDDMLRSFLYDFPKRFNWKSMLKITPLLSGEFQDHAVELIRMRLQLESNYTNESELRKEMIKFSDLTTYIDISKFAPLLKMSTADLFVVVATIYNCNKDVVKSKR